VRFQKFEQFLGVGNGVQNDDVVPCFFNFLNCEVGKEIPKALENQPKRIVHFDFDNGFLYNTDLLTLNQSSVLEPKQLVSDE
jgi:hypothetical protein